MEGNVGQYSVCSRMKPTVTQLHDLDTLAWTRCLKVLESYGSEVVSPRRLMYWPRVFSMIMQTGERTWKGQVPSWQEVVASMVFGRNRGLFWDRLVLLRGSYNTTRLSFYFFLCSVFFPSQVITFLQVPTMVMLPSLGGPHCRLTQ